MTETGPQYPPPPAFGSNAIGSFAIGISPMGDISPFDVWTTIISQYANSKILTQLILNLDAYIDPIANFNAFFDMIWNIDSAVGAGLDIWGRIIGVSRTLTVAPANYFGFQQEGPTADTFGPGGLSPFYVGATSTNNFNLTDPSYRTLLFAKALANICDGSIPAINQILRNLFPNRGNCYVTDGLDMTMTYTFKFQLSPTEAAIVSASGVLPRSTGVSSTVVQIF